MRQITAGSVGMNWRSDVSHAAHFDVVQVVDLNGNKLGTVSTAKDAIGRESWYLNGQRVAYDRIWEQMHKWSNVVAEQQTKAFRAACTHPYMDGNKCRICTQIVK
jgi:hypothetical protein